MTRRASTGSAPRMKCRAAAPATAHRGQAGALRIAGALIALAPAACVTDMPTDPLSDAAAGGTPSSVAYLRDAALDQYLASLLNGHGFTGRLGETLESRLGRRLDRRLADVGRLIFFDPVTGLNDDNSCSGCHSPTAGFGDTQPIAIGVDNNNVVGPGRTGPRNQRRSPTIINSAFFPTLMWNSRFRALSDDPFDNSSGFSFPDPEGLSLSHMPHLLAAQAHIPFTERVEMAGFEFQGGNDDIRNEVLRRLNAIPLYRTRFGEVFPEVRAGGSITFDHVGRAIGEFTFTLTFADAPIDRFARGRLDAMSAGQKRGAILFFADAGCVQCHAVAGASSELFSDFREHVLGVPQIAPSGGNVEFHGPGQNEDFGLEELTGDPADRYAFRTSPLRNIAVQPTFMHNGAFLRLEDAIRHHLDVHASVGGYTTAGLPADLQGPLGPMDPVLERLDPLLAAPIVLTDDEFAWLVEFVRDGLLDDRARPERLMHLVPGSLPSGRRPHTFEVSRRILAAGTGTAPATATGSVSR
jgi:cytochrome c peroxidase